MESKIDGRGVLDEGIFDYRISKDRKVFISWHGKQVTVLNGERAEDFIESIEGADGKDAQLIMAKATGNFKRGNEKQNKRKH